LSRVYFTDRNLGKQFPAILATAGLQVERHQDLFTPDGSDEQWLEYCGANGRIALTHDQRIRYKANELGAVMRHRVAMLLVIGKAPYPELAKRLVATLPKIEAFLDTHEPPFVAKVYRASPAEVARDAAASGKILLWYPT
jgi:predicted nuclease of predicted toxin-antitoxin system